jgi:plasmid stabilization system protein ParE
MTGLSRETRLQIMLDQAELAAIDDYRFEHRIPSRAAAVRQLLKLGLQALGSEPTSGRRSAEYGVLRNSDGSGDDSSAAD